MSCSEAAEDYRKVNKRLFEKQVADITPIEDQFVPRSVVKKKRDKS
ncbi:hypothetical protein [Pleurocapsa sp. PCC 7319]|nr:hypothetical protein [Pleurocapsa sp. PCC 7319]